MKTLFLLILFSGNICYSQVYSGPRSESLGTTASTLKDIWAIQNNPAGICDLDRIRIEVNYTAHYLDPDLSTQVILIAFPFSENALGLSFQKYGIEEYSEKTVGLGFSKKFGESFSAGVGFNLRILEMNQYGYLTTLSAKAGVQVNLSRDFILAFFISNLNSLQTARESGDSAIGNIGFSWLFSEGLTCFGEIKKEWRNRLIVKTGIEYVLNDSFSIRGGLSLRPIRQYMGFGIRLKNFGIETAVSSHFQLGLTPQISIGYDF